MKIKNVTLIFENCDSITIEGKYIGNMIVDDIRSSFKKLGSDTINKIDVANVFAIEIHKEANEERYELNQTGNEALRQMTFDRLKKYNDITSIKFELEEDGQATRVESYEYWAKWVGDSYENNEAQTTYLSKDGHLYIVIAEGKGIEDFFSMVNINDSEYMDFHFKWCCDEMDGV